MQTKSYNMPGIVRVFWLLAENLAPYLAEQGIADLKIVGMKSGHEITLEDTAQVDCSLTVENNSVWESATLEFRTNDKLPTRADVVWVIQDAQGEWWIMGAREKKYPVLEMKYTSGKPGSDAGVKSVKVQHQALKALIKLA